MRSEAMTMMMFALLASGFAVQSLAAGAEQARGRQGSLHASKDCSAYTGAAGAFCTPTSSNLDEIKSGSTVTYDQALGIPANMIDSNAILDAGGGNRAIGRCTVDFAALTGLCTFSDGTGQFAGFRARVNVTNTGVGTWRWDGTYSFDQLHE